MQNFIDIITERGFVHQMTDEAGLRKLLETPGQTAYIGFDCTAKSLHVGSLLQIMLLRWWQKCGHKPIVLLGGGTTKIGDPSGKDESRPPLTDAQINENMDSLKQVFSKFIDFDNAIMVNNDDWLSKLSLMDMLQIGRHFSVNRMVKQKSVQLRLERDQEMSLLEFNYSVMQAYDFAELYKLHQCRVQLGGSDQWGNIVAGIDLNRRLLAVRQDTPQGISIELTSLKKLEDNELFGITSPLLTTAAGAKMGKTAAGAVWLNADLLSPYDYWQFWRNTEDADVVKFLKLFTELSLDEIATLGALEGAGINQAKIVLATEATALLHGRDAADKAARTAADTFSGSGVSADLPTYSIQKEMLTDGEFLRSHIVTAGWATSNGDVRRLIEGGGIKLNDIKITDYHYKLTLADFNEGLAKLSKKKDHVLIKIQ